MEERQDLISRQAAIDAICAVCGNDCDKSEFVYNAPQDEQVILCPEHYCLCNLPSAQPERKTGRMSNKDWIDFLCEQFDISRTSARDMLHEMMKCKKEDNFKRVFNPMLNEGEA